jgi:hypothetical protein
VRAIKQKHDGRQQACTSAERKVSPRRARRGKHWGGARVPGPQLSSRERDGGLACAWETLEACVCLCARAGRGSWWQGRSLLMVIVARSVGDARCMLDYLVPGASAGLLLIDCALFAACHYYLRYSNQQSPDSKGRPCMGTTALAALVELRLDR